MLNLKEIREELGLSKISAAKKIGISRSFYTEIEQGKHVPSLMTACKICLTFNITPNELIKKEYWSKQQID